LQYLDCSPNQLTSLNVSGLTNLQTLACSGNQLTFSTLSLPPNYSGDIYNSSQAQMPISLISGNTIDLSSEYLGGTTTYTWYYANGSQVASNFYTNANGMFTFTGLPSGTEIYCRMTNTNFPGLTLRTTPVSMTAPTLIPDLAATNGGTVPSSIIRGNAFSVTTGTIRNDGTAVSGSYTITFYAFTSDPTSSNIMGINIGSVSMSSLAANGTTTATLNVSATNSALLTGSSYYIGWHITPVTGEANISNNWAYHTTAMGVTELSSPTKPTGLTGSVSDRAVTLSWTPDSNADTYTVQYMKMPAGKTLVTLIESDWTVNNGAITVPGITGHGHDIFFLDYSSEYVFRVRAVNTVGSSPYSDAIARTTPDDPTDPRLRTPVISVTATGSSTISVTWSAILNASGYRVQYATDGQFTDILGTVNVSSTSATIAGLHAGTTYYVRSMAIGTGFDTNSAWSDVKSSTTISPPTTPAKLTASSITQNSMLLSWSASNHATGYELWYKVRNASNWTKVDVTSTYYSITGLSANTTYDIQLRAVNSTTWLTSPWVGQTVTTLAPPAQPPAAPANFAVKSGSVSSTGITLTWSGQTGLTGYTLQYKKSSDSESAWTNYTTNIAGTATEIAVTGLAAGTKYDFRLTARNNDGNSPATVLRNIETVGLGTNYAVLYSGGAYTSANYPHYYNAIKDLYTVLVSSYN
jgi:hypothetical protein